MGQVPKFHGEYLAIPKFSGPKLVHTSFTSSHSKKKQYNDQKEVTVAITNDGGNQGGVQLK
jgi:hypothetical protein